MMFKQRACCHLIMCILFRSGNEKAKGNPPRVQTSLFEMGEYQSLEAPFSRTRGHIYRSICAHGRKFQNLFQLFRLMEWLLMETF